MPKKTTGKIVLKIRKDGEPMFDVKGNNNKIIVTGQGYASSPNAKRGVQALKKALKRPKVINQLKTSPVKKTAKKKST